MGTIFLQTNNNVLLTCVLFLVAHASVSAQSFEDWSFGFYLGDVPFKTSTISDHVILGREADLSPVPSIVLYNDFGSKRTYSAGLLARQNKSIETGRSWAEWAGMAEWMNIFGSSELSVASGGAGGFLNYGIGKRAVASIGGMVLIGYNWGMVGFVGIAEGDRYLDAPDGNRYFDGAGIEARAFTLGTDLMVGLEYRSSGQSLRFDAGMRFMSEPSEWRYRVREDGQSSTLPADGFDSNPPSYGLSGYFLRIGFLYNLKN